MATQQVHLLELRGRTNTVRPPTNGPTQALAALRLAKFTSTRQLTDGSQVAFVRHPDYLAMNLPVAPRVQLFNAVRTAVNLPLRSRNDSHITVITPPEFAVLKARLSMADLERIASRIQQSTVTPIGVGMGSSQNLSTYFVVVDAPQLRAIRQAVQNAFVANGGAPTAFRPAAYNPHITLGFSSRDLFEQDGVIKDRNSIPNPAGLTIG